MQNENQQESMVGVASTTESESKIDRIEKPKENKVLIGGMFFKICGDDNSSSWEKSIQQPQPKKN